MNYCVYKHTSPSGKVYIGITCMDPIKRFSNGRGYGSRTVFGKAIKKYGWSNIESTILLSGLTEMEAKQKECELILLYKSTDRNYGYNMSLGGDGTSGVKASIEQRRLMSEKRTGDQNHFFGKKHSEQSKFKIKKNHADFSGENHPSFGMKRSEESKQKMSENHADVSGKNNPNWGKGNPVVQLDRTSGKVINTFQNMNRAAEETGFNRITIGACCNGRIKSAYGFIWKFERDL